MLMAYELESNVKDYRKFWIMYIKKLCDTECKGKLTEICDILAMNENSKFDVLLQIEIGLSRQDILDEVLNITSNFSTLQRLKGMYQI